MLTLRPLAVSHTCSFARPRKPQSRLETTRTRRPSALSVQPATSVRLETSRYVASVRCRCSTAAVCGPASQRRGPASRLHSARKPSRCLCGLRKSKLSHCWLCSRAVACGLLEAERASPPSALSAHAVTSSVCPCRRCLCLSADRVQYTQFFSRTGEGQITVRAERTSCYLVLVDL